MRRVAVDAPRGRARGSWKLESTRITFVVRAQLRSAQGAATHAPGLTCTPRRVVALVNAFSEKWAVCAAHRD